MKIDELVGKYIELRDQKARLKADYDAKVAGIDKAMTLIEAAMLQHFNATGSDSVNVRGVGTAYRTTKTSCTVADKDSFMKYVRENDAWEMLDIRANKTTVSQFRAANDDIPPGLNWSETVGVNFNRS